MAVVRAGRGTPTPEPRCSGLEGPSKPILVLPASMPHPLPQAEFSLVWVLGVLRPDHQGPQPQASPVQGPALPLDYGSLALCRSLNCNL